MTPHPQPEYILTENLLDRIYDMAYSHGCMPRDEEHNKKLSTLYDEIQSRPVSSQQSERDNMLDDLCNIDLTYYVWGEKQSDDVEFCRGKDCNYCGRYNAELRKTKQAGEQE